MIQYIKQKRGEKTMVTRAKRATNNRWDAKNMCVLGCKVRKEEAERFRTACKVLGTSPNEVFRTAMRDFMAEHTGEGASDLCKVTEAVKDAQEEQGNSTAD